MVLYDRAMYQFAFFVRDAAIACRRLDGQRLLVEMKKTGDADKGKEFVRLAKGMGVPANWERFGQAYREVGGVRNWLAHVTDMTAQPNESVPTIAWTFSEGERGRLGALGGEARIDSVIVRRRLVDATWVLHHVEWARQEIGLRPGYFGWAESPVSRPTSEPVY